MLRKLTSPTKGSRFATSAASKQDRDVPKVRSPVAGSGPAFEMDPGVGAEAKSPPTAPTKTRLSLWNKKTPTKAAAAAEVPRVDPTSAVTEAARKDLTQTIDKAAESTAFGSIPEFPHDEEKSQTSRETAAGKRTPLKRSPRQRSILNVDAESKAVSSKREPSNDEEKAQTASETATGKRTPLKRSPRQRSILNVVAESKATGSAVAAPGEEMIPRETATPPLKRSPRQRSTQDVAADAKPSSPPKREPAEEKKTKPRSKRDSLGLKSLMTKRDKAIPRDEKLEPLALKEIESKTERDVAEPAQNRMVDRSPTTKNAGEEASDPPTLSPIRRKPRPSREELGNQKSTTATIREATSLLSRKTAGRIDGGLPPMHQPEVHIIGEIVGGEGFGSASDGYCCKWSVDYGSQWIHIAGDEIGQTQIDYSDAAMPDEGAVVWAHPIDLHFATTALQGWPKLLLQVWRVDSYMQMNVVGYGFVHLPFAPGQHRLTVAMWRPMGTLKEELGAALLGQTPELLTDEVLFNTAWADRCRLKTIATGRVHISVGIIVRNFECEGASRIDM